MENERYILDTSALLSLESAGILIYVLKKYEVVVSPSVLVEIEHFAMHDDTLGRVAKKILKRKIVKLIPRIKKHIQYISATDNDLFNLAITNKSYLVTDDLKFARHCQGKVESKLSTLFLFKLVIANVLTKEQAIERLEKMRDQRNWQNNIIYLTTKEELNNM